MIYLRVSIIIRVIIIQLYLMALNQWYNDIKKYWTAAKSQEENQQNEENSFMPKLSRINRLSKILQTSVYIKLYQEQICMFYSQIIEEYPKSISKMHLPSYIYQPEIYTPLLNIAIPLIIQTKELYCQLELLILLPKDLPHQMPTFIIKNPDFQIYKPRHKYVKFGKYKTENIKYSAIYGGISIVIPKQMKDLWNWNEKQYYKQKGILNMIKWVHQTLLIENFPFSKRKLQISTQFTKVSKYLSQFLNKNVHCKERQNQLEQIPLLENIQSANTLSNSINSQIAELKTQIKQMASTLEKSKSYIFKQFYPMPRDQKSEAILQALSSLQAYKDCQYELEKWSTTKKISFIQFKQAEDRISSQKFRHMTLLGHYQKDDS